MSRYLTRNKELLLYTAIAFLVLFVATVSLASLVQQIGRPFAGVILSRNFQYRTVGVDPYTPVQWIGIQHGLRGGDVVLAINGLPPQNIGEALENVRAEPSLTYVVYRNGVRLHISVPLTVVSWNQVIEPYVALFLSGFFSLMAGLFLLRGAKRLYTRLISFALLMTGAATLYFLQKRGITEYYWNPWAYALFFIPTYPFLSALLIHLFFVCPRKFSLISRHPRLVLLPYIIALIMSIFLVIGMLLGGAWNMGASWGTLMLLVVAVVSVLSRGIWVLIRFPQQRAMVAGLVIAFGVGLILAIGLGVIPLVTRSFPLWLNKFLVPLMVIYPFLLVYTVKNAELVERLQQQIAMHQQLEAEAQELHHIRERTLQEIADALHDTVVSSVRGLQLWLKGMEVQREKEEHVKDEMSEDFLFIEETLEKIYWNARRIMEGAKLVDFEQVGLIEALEHTMEHLRRSHPHISFSLHVQEYDEDYAPHVKEEVFWIAQSALINACEHASAEHVRLSLSKHDGRLRLIISDDGIGFDVTQVLRSEFKDGRRCLGVRNMFARASRIHGQLFFERQERGMRIELVVPVNDSGEDTHAHCSSLNR